MLATIGLVVLAAVAVDAKCIFGHTKGQQYVVEQTYHSSDNLKFVYTCSSRKFDEGSPEFFYYQLDSCTAANVTYTPGDRWRNGAFMYECFFRVSKEEGSISEVRHVGCYVQDYLIEKDVEALIGNYRFACDELGLHPITCISTKEGIEMTPGEAFTYGLDSYSCNETDTGLSLEERTREEECVLSGRVAVAYLIDTSESIKEADFDAVVRPAVAKELASLPDSFLVRLTVYSTNWRSHTGWLNVGEAKADLAAEVASMPYLGEGTMTAASLLKTAELFEGVRAEAKFIVLLTDGEARDKKDIPKVVRRLDQKGIKVVSVGIGSEIEASELEEYGYSVIELQGLGDLESALGQGIIRCKIFERLVKIRDAKRECDAWAEEDVPMEANFMPTCALTRAQMEADEESKKDPSCTDIYSPPPPGPGWKNCQLNRGADVCFHTKFVGIRYGGKDGKVYRSRSQCCYGASGALLTSPIRGAGSADKASQLYVHVKEDLRPAEYCKEAGMTDLYNLHRPPGVNDPSSISPNVN